MFILGGDWDTVDTTPQFTLGALGMDYDGKIYKYIRYLEGAAAVDGVAGEVAAYVKQSVAAAKSDSYVTNTYQVTSDYSDSTELGAGVLQAALSDEQFGWIQVRGQATLSIATQGPAADNAFLSVTVAGTPAGDGTLVTATTVVVDEIVAQAWDASAKIIICMFPL